MAHVSQISIPVEPSLADLHIAGWREKAAYLMNQHFCSIGFARGATSGRAAVALAAAARHRDTAARYLRACRLHASGLDLDASLAGAGLHNPFGSVRS